MGTLLPMFSAVFQVLAVVPLALVTYQVRARAGVGALIATILMSLALGGTQTGLAAAQSAVLGAVVGWLLRRGARWWTTAATCLGIGALFGAAAGGVLWLLSGLRELYLESTRVSAKGWTDLIGKIDALRPAMDQVLKWVDWFLDTWWIWVPLSAFVGAVVVLLLTYAILGAVLKRLDLGSTDDRLLDAMKDTGAPSPLPLSLHGVSYTYPAADRPALTGIDLTVEPGGLTVIVGPNGSGKSTLTQILAGAAPTTGTVDRPGSVGLGRSGGTALLQQRSELQALGDTVAEDVLWGLDPADAANADVDALLVRVGLPGMATIPTRTLSGGQLQRLALAGILARRPALLISDESTAMVDPAGRRELVGLLATLSHEGMTVVHVTHDDDEAELADRTIRIEDGRITSDAPARQRPDASRGDEGAAASSSIQKGAPWVPRPQDTVTHLWADRVTQAYDVGTPWENIVLHNLSLTLSSGQSLLITGRNGSGKTTLARVLTGLATPTWGRCTFAGQPMAMHIGDVGYSMQFARMQVLRPNVRTDILAAARVPASVSQIEGDRIVARALDEVGLPAELATRGIDQLSGGQLRRVALAGLLAQDPALLILDEPLAGLDDAARTRVIDVLETRRRRGMGFLVISHDTDQLGAICQETLELEGGVLE